MSDTGDWPLYEIFICPRGGLDHKHVGSVHAADAAMNSVTPSRKMPRPASASRE